MSSPEVPVLRLGSDFKAPEAQMPASYVPRSEILQLISSAVSAVTSTIGQANGIARLDASGNVLNGAGQIVGGGSGGGVDSNWIKQNADGTWPARPNSLNPYLWVTLPGLGGNPPGVGTTSSQTGMAPGDLLAAGP